MNIPIFHIHGLPGSTGESELFTSFKPANLLHLKPFGVAGQEKLIQAHSQFSIVAFSLGSKTAMEIAAAYPQKVQKITLVSPAAPLELGNFLPHMDGRMVFEIAQANSLLYALMTFGMGMMAQYSPAYLMKRMFGESCEAEQELLKNETFRRVFCQGLKQSLVDERVQYMKAVKEFGQPWADTLNQVVCPVEIWHGTRDTWAPFAMGQALAKRIGKNATLVPCDTLGHYSTFRKWSEKNLA